MQHLARSATRGVVRSRLPRRGNTQVLGSETPKLVTSLSPWESQAWKESAAQEPQCDVPVLLPTRPRASLRWRVRIKRQKKYLRVQPTRNSGTSQNRWDKEAAGKKKCKWSSFWREAAMARTQWLALNSFFKSGKTCWRAKSRMFNPVKWAHSRSNF